jgi:hypothetical protein
VIAANRVKNSPIWEQVILLVDVECVRCDIFKAVFDFARSSESTAKKSVGTNLDALRANVGHLID